MKVNYMGRQIRTREGRFTKRRRSFWVILVGVMTLYGVIAFMPGKPVEYVAPQQVSAQTIDRTPEKLEKLKTETVNLISGCEVNGYKEGDAPIILDTNNKMSIGPMMFQLSTVIHYEKQLYGKDITPKEAALIALDADQAKQLANDILFKAGGANNWYTCSKKNDIAQRISLIKEMEEN